MVFLDPGLYYIVAWNEINLTHPLSNYIPSVSIKSNAQHSLEKKIIGTKI